MELRRNKLLRKRYFHYHKISQLYLLSLKMLILESFNLTHFFCLDSFSLKLIFFKERKINQFSDFSSKNVLNLVKVAIIRQIEIFQTIGFALQNMSPNTNSHTTMKESIKKEFVEGFIVIRLIFINNKLRNLTLFHIYDFSLMVDKPSSSMHFLVKRVT